MFTKLLKCFISGHKHGSSYYSHGIEVDTYSHYCERCNEQFGNLPNYGCYNLPHRPSLTVVVRALFQSK